MRRPSDYARFLEGMGQLAVLFQEAMDDERLALYWQVLGPALTLEEWEAACLLAMQRETFYKIPLPATLLAYGLEYRAQRTAAQRAWRAAQGLPLRDVTQDRLSLAEVRALLARLWPDGWPQPLPGGAGEVGEGVDGTQRDDAGRTPHAEQARHAELLQHAAWLTQEKGETDA
jgi:hypothetical protein